MLHVAGAGAVKGSLRALNQSVSSQVASLMKDPSKLARRTGVAAQQRPRVLCQPAEPLAAPVAEPLAELAEVPDQVDGRAVGGSRAEIDFEAFDDGEFYAQLLKEFLDSSSAGSHQAAGMLPQVCSSSCSESSQVLDNNSVS